MCHASVEISQGVVFQRNGALDIICRTNDTSAYDVMFVLRHNGIIIRNSKSNIRWPGADWLYYKFHVENATQKDAGEYECNIQQEKGTVVSMTATMVEGMNLFQFLDVPLSFYLSVCFCNNKLRINPFPHNDTF